MSIDTEYDSNNIFAKILRGEIPCVKIWESDAVLAFMDVFPQSRGHCLVIHKKSNAQNFFDIEPAALSELIASVQKIAGGVRNGLNPDGVRIVQFNGEAAGQTVFHLHFHIIPIYEGEALRSHGGGGAASVEILEPIAAKIRSALN